MKNVGQFKIKQQQIPLPLSYVALFPLSKTENYPLEAAKQETFLVNFAKFNLVYLMFDYFLKSAF